MEPNTKHKNIPLIIAFVGTLLVNVPQLYKTWKTKDVKAFSVYTMVLRILIHVAWIVYGIMEADALIITMSTEVMFCEMLLLLFKQIYSQEMVIVTEHAPDVPMAPRHGTVYRRSFGDNIHVLVASV